MTTFSTRSDATSVTRIAGPADLLDAIPYLLGFHAHDSLVLVGLHNSMLVMTARVDLEDLDAGAIDLIAAMQRGGASLLVAVVYDDRVDPRWWREAPLLDNFLAAAAALEAEVADVLLVAGGRWWSAGCDDPECCPPEGRPLGSGDSRVAAEATFAGMTALPDRFALEATLAPVAAREQLLQALNARRARVQRRPPTVASAVRAILSTARRAAKPGWAGVDDATAVRFGVALREIAVRDEVWLAIDESRELSPLWAELARRLPSPYDAAPLLFVGWAAWRTGNGALANIAADRALASDPGYSAARLLLAAVSNGLDPRAFPTLQAPLEP